VSSGRYNTIERSDAFLDQVAKEMITQRSGAVDDNQISELGRQAGADFVCIGEMLEAFGEWQISARIVNGERCQR
jgi:TolB-like protein